MSREKMETRHIPKATLLTIIQRLPHWCKLVLAVLDWVMLIIMTYEMLMFVEVVTGLGLGFALFKDTDDCAKRPH